MDTTFSVSIIIAMVAIVPGIWALINQINKDKIQVKFDMARVSQGAALNLVDPLLQEVSRLQIRAGTLEAYVRNKEDKSIEVSEYEKPIIVRCDHCRSANIITSLECIKCGAPLDIK
jgi:hypothetical protein